MTEWLIRIGWVAALALPFFNIPLVLRMMKTKSSKDLSIIWVLGIFFCLLAMEPAALLSEDLMFKTFATANLLLFSVVTFFVFYFRFRAKK